MSVSSSVCRAVGCLSRVMDGINQVHAVGKGGSRNRRWRWVKIFGGGFGMVGGRSAWTFGREFEM